MKQKTLKLIPSYAVKPEPEETPEDDYKPYVDMEFFRILQSALRAVSVMKELKEINAPEFIIQNQKTLITKYRTQILNYMDDVMK